MDRRSQMQLSFILSVCNQNSQDLPIFDTEGSHIFHKSNDSKFDKGKTYLMIYRL